MAYYACAIEHNFLSKRAKVVENWEDFLNKYMYLCYSNEYDPETNPDGYINLGTAVNNMCNDIVYPKITSGEIWSCDTSLLQYQDARGIFRLRKAVATLMTEFLKTHKPVDPDNLFCAVGVTACIDVLGHCLADPGDVIMVPTPVYGRIHTDLKQRSLVDMWPIPIITKDNTEAHPQLTLNKVANAYEKAILDGKNVRGIILLNPSNPLGDIYSPDLMMSILEFCKKAKIHVIIDEVYALSVYDDDSKFKSVLSFSKLPDPDRTHVLYGISKDFTLAGLRIGVIHTQCQGFKACLQQLTFFQGIPFPVMSIAARFMEDLHFCRNLISVNKKRLCAKFKYCKKRLEGMDIPVRDSKGAFFLWVDLRKRCGISTFKEEISFFDNLIKSFRLYIVPGKELFCDQPGWFRISFTGRPDHVAKGLDRLEAAINNAKPLVTGLPVKCGDVDETKVEIFDTSRSELDENGLEHLLSMLKTQLHGSNWLSDNTADKWIAENPDLKAHFVKDSEN